MNSHKRFCRIPFIRTVLAFVLVSPSLSAQSESSVGFSPVIGDTLDGLERSQLELFPDADGFLWAVFLVNKSGGNLKAKICSMHEGRLRLQIVNMEITPSFLQRKIELTFEQDIRIVVHEVKRETVRGIGDRARRMPNPAVDSVLILSPKVGEEIDLTERNRFGMFSSLKGFERAVFFRTPDTAYYAQVLLSRKDGVARDTCIEFTEGVIRQLAERIDHYTDKARAKSVVDTTHWQQLPDALPLARNLTSLSRPFFQTVHLDIGLGISFGDFSGIRSLIGGSPVFPSSAPGSSSGTLASNASSEIAIPLSFFLHVPLSEDPSISFVGGWGFAVGGVLGGSLSTFSAMLVLESHSVFFPFDPIIGFGIGYTGFSYSQSVIINASVSYPMVVFGANLARNHLNMILTIPITTGLESTFEGKSYSIYPAGPSLTLQVCL